MELSFKVKIAFFCTYCPVNGAWDPQRKKKHRQQETQDALSKLNFRNPNLTKACSNLPL